MTTPILDPNTTPLSVNPSGAPPNFIDPPTQAPTVLGTGILLIIISTLCRQFASQILISPVKFAITSAIIIVYKRIFGVLKWVRIVSYSLYIFLFLIQVQNIGIAIYWYTPRKGDVNNIQVALLRTEKTASSAIANAVCSTIVDIVLFLVPMAVVPTLNMSPQKRRAIYGVFCFGALIIIADCVGIAYKTYGVLGEHGDPFWVGMIAIITVYAETFALVIISCIPALSTFYIGTVIKSRFYSTLQYGILHRLRRSEASNIPSSGLEQPNSMHSTRSLVGSGKNVATIEMPEFKSKKPSQASSYSTLGNQESGQAHRSS
ncbi:uncharacterized protein EAE98_010354 [Botrytis deweyae]|uniref:Rhodopsin domain-containing protein n=1 Tax=Botrytis deweyae TaxID=2478750 RepID=A0ABQ7I987_9HELO|nr:uncharacterized protein EAE98_010354 [Botrytis deweyae]KAF7917249.1 hypothetical protein EAE98_010354 [Botrytis deweyae]